MPPQGVSRVKGSGYRWGGMGRFLTIRSAYAITKDMEMITPPVFSSELGQPGYSFAEEPLVAQEPEEEEGVPSVLGEVTRGSDGAGCRVLLCGMQRVWQHRCLTGTYDAADGDGTPGDEFADTLLSCEDDHP